VKLGGVEALLKLLRGGLDADSVRALIKALAELLKETTAQEVRLPWNTMCYSCKYHRAIMAASTG
jgi:hypothetical protein